MPVINRVPELVAAKYGDKKINLKEVEAATELDYRTVSAWMKNRVTRADFPVLEKWCNYLGVDVGDILVYRK